MTYTLNKSKAEQLAKDLLTWLQTEENYLIKKFFTEKQVSFKLFLQYTSQDPVKSLFELAQDIQEVKMTEMLTSKKFATTGIQALLKHIGGWNDEKSSQAETKLDKDTLDKLTNRFFPPPDKK
ncbi:MAG: hypothetical protein IAE93_12985 [Ignavibacteria bacterium]|nr:hypothetical protein [Ignavibacteria bacterium]